MNSKATQTMTSSPDSTHADTSLDVRFLGMSDRKLNVIDAAVSKEVRDALRKRLLVRAAVRTAWNTIIFSPPLPDMSLPALRPSLTQLPSVQEALGIRDDDEETWFDHFLNTMTQPGMGFTGVNSQMVNVKFTDNVDPQQTPQPFIPSTPSPSSVSPPTTHNPLSSPHTDSIWVYMNEVVDDMIDREDVDESLLLEHLNSLPESFDPSPTSTILSTSTVDCQCQDPNCIDCQLDPEFLSILANVNPDNIPWYDDLDGLPVLHRTRDETEQDESDIPVMSHSLSSSSSTESECLTPLSAINSAIIPELILPSPDAEEEIHGYVETGTNVGSGEEVSNVKRQHGEESVLGVTGLGKVGGVGWFGGGYSG